jgi:hypothetical protein
MILFVAATVATNAADEFVLSEQQATEGRGSRAKGSRVCREVVSPTYASTATATGGAGGPLIAVAVGLVLFAVGRILLDRQSQCGAQPL